ncbi:hypothetical protein PTKIN_Ptkin18bG0046400 [Pterospermum kingtungense]
MSSQSTTQNVAHTAGEMTGQDQVKRDEMMDQAPYGQTIHSQSQPSGDQNTTYTSQATTFLQQTGEQMKNMAQGAADAVKTTLGMNNANNTSNAPNTNTADTATTNSSTTTLGNPLSSNPSGRI